MGPRQKWICKGGGGLGHWTARVSFKNLVLFISCDHTVENENDDMFFLFFFSTCHVDCEVCAWTLHFMRFTVW